MWEPDCGRRGRRFGSRRRGRGRGRGRRARRRRCCGRRRGAGRGRRRVDDHRRPQPAGGARAAARRPAQLHGHLAGRPSRRRLCAHRPHRHGGAANARPRAAGRTLAFPELNLDGQLALLGAVDDPGRWLRLRSGRLPRTCVPARCEVLQAKGTPVNSLAEPGLRLVVVGRTAGPLPVSLGGLTAVDALRIGEPPPVLVAGSISAAGVDPRLLGSLPQLQLDDPDRPGSLHDWQIQGLLEPQSTHRTASPAWNAVRPHRARPRPCSR